MLRRIVWGFLLLLLVGIQTNAAGWIPEWTRMVLLVSAALLLLDEWARDRQ